MNVLLRILIILLLFDGVVLELINHDDADDFAHWLPGHVQQEGGLQLLDRRALSQGEVLLFRTKKSRHRAIPVMSGAVPSGAPIQRISSAASRFSDALTFKEWLRRVYREEKALKVSVRTTEVVRPVLQHLYATRAYFHAPIIVHANTFEGAGPSQEKPVDVVHLVESARQILPDAILSLGWTPSEDWAAVNRLDWQQAFQLLQLLRGLDRKQPIMLNMRLNDAVHSAEVLEWLLGIDNPAIYLLLRGDVGDFVDSDSPLKRLARLNSGAQRRRLLFDVDENWRTRIRRFVPGGNGKFSEEEPYAHQLDRTQWLNWLFPSSSHHPHSTSVLSPAGAAFLGWPNSLLLSTRVPAEFPARQSLSGRVMFLAKRQTREILPQRKSGMVIYLFDHEPDLLFTPRVPNAIQAFIGFDGRVSLENHGHHLLGHSTKNGKSSTLYPKSSTAQLPKWPCYGFWLLDKGWRIELEVWTEQCAQEEDLEQEQNKLEESEWISQRTFLQLDTPVGRSRKSRHIAIGKSGDGAIDFLLRGLQHNSAMGTHRISLQLVVLLTVCALFAVAIAFTPILC